MADRGRKRGNRGDDANGWGKWGGYMEAKKQKLHKQFNDSVSDGQISNIFAGISIFVNGYTVPCADELKRLMAVHGGQYHNYYNRLRTTHIIATNLPDTKIKDLRGEKIVKPEWITDSIQKGSLLPCQPYQLYIQASRLQPTLNFQRTGESKDAKISVGKEESDRKERTESKVVDEFQVLETWRSAVKKSPVTSVRKQVPEVVTKSKESCVTTSKAAGTNLLQEFYNNSRLHYISTMANKFKSYVSKLQKDLDSTVMPGRVRLSQWLQSQGERTTTLMPKQEKVVMHIDMDCFFVSVGIRNRPDLKGKPVAVTHSKGAPPRAPEGAGSSDARNYEAEYYGKRRSKGDVEEGYDDEDEMVIHDSSDEECEKRVAGGPIRVEDYGSMSEVACSSYEAREFGVRNGTLLGEALKLCPQLQMIAYDFKGYEEVATILYDLVASYTLQMEAVSCDELYADCTDVLWETRATPIEFATFLRQEVLQRTGCNCSIGIAENMLLARLATKKAKPNGQFHLKPEHVADFMSEQKIADLPGVGWALNLRIRTISSGISKCSELQKVPLKTLQNELGPKTGISLHNLCRGIDDRCVNSEKGRKSVSADVNYGIRFTKDEDAVSFVSELALEVRNRLRAVTAKGRTVTLKVKVRKKDAPKETAKFMGHGVCDNMARSVAMKTATDDDQMIAKECHSLLRQMKVPVVDLRGVGIQVSRLEVQKLTDNHHHDNSTLHKYLKPLQTETTNQKQEPDYDDDFKETKTTKDVKKEATALFPSNFEEVDATVLASLPEDIRLQVEEEFKLQGKKEVPPVPPVPLPPQQNTEKTMELPTSLSQIDPSVLGQLPKDIVDEITSMYSNKSSTKGPNAEQSPKRGSKKQVRAKRTPKKSSPDKKQVPYRHLTISQMFNKIGSPTKKTKDNIETVNLDEDSSRDSPAKEVPETPEPSSERTTDRPNLMGRVELVDVRKLICEWISEFDVPLVEDEDIFCRYVRRLVEERDLERAHVVVRHTCRQLLLKKKHDWLRFYSEMVDQLQTAVFARHGSHLDLPSLRF